MERSWGLEMVSFRWGQVANELKLPCCHGIGVCSKQIEEGTWGTPSDPPNRWGQVTHLEGHVVMIQLWRRVCTRSRVPCYMGKTIGETVAHF